VRASAAARHGDWPRRWFPARDGVNETDVCAPSPGGGVASRDDYDALVAQMRNGAWERAGGWGCTGV
jgi:hypothetical protein